MSFHSQIFSTGDWGFTVPSYEVLVVLVGGPGQGGTGSAGPIDPPPGNGGRSINLAIEEWLTEYPDRPSLFVGDLPSADTLFNSGAGLVKGTGCGRGLPTGGTYNTNGSGGVGGSTVGTGVTGGSGNLAVKIYFPGDLAVGTSIPISIPAGGAGEAGSGTGGVNGSIGGSGFVKCYWTDSGSHQVLTASGTFSPPGFSTLTVFEFASGGGSKGTDAGTGISHDGGAAGNSTFNASVIAVGGGDSSTSAPGSGSGGDESIQGAGANGGGSGFNAGGFTYKTYAGGSLSGSISVVIPNGGVGGAGTGTPGTPGTKGQTIVSFIPVATPHNQAFVIG